MDSLGHMYPAIKRMVDPYLPKFKGWVKLWKILTAANVTVSQLPTMGGLTEGNRNKLCYLRALGKCPHQAWEDCQFTHASRHNVSNEHANIINCNPEVLVVD